MALGAEAPATADQASVSCRWNGRAGRVPEVIFRAPGIGGELAPGCVTSGPVSLRTGSGRSPQASVVPAPVPPAGHAGGL